MPLSIAIIGSGPSAFYTAEALIKHDQDCEIDIIERLPAPFGLIRYGVAPDHQTTKNVVKAYDKTARNAAVRYFGNVEIGRDISMEELRRIYDAVVLAVGAPKDNPLTIPGSDKAGVIGSADLVGWYNGHPDYRDLQPDLSGGAVAVIGNGNVALDIARLLVKTPAELAASDISHAAAETLQASSVTDVYMFGRRGPIEAKFTNVELREMAELENCTPLLNPDHLPDQVGDLGDAREQRLKEKNLATLRGFLDVDATGKSRRVHFSFFASPVEILGDHKVSGIRMERTEVREGRAVGTVEFFELECTLVLPAIGYRSTPMAGVPFDEAAGKVVNDDGRVAPGLYVVGWAKRGPTGVIASNRPDGRTVADHIAADLSPSDKPGRAGLLDYMNNTVRFIGYDDWLKIDAGEQAAVADSPAPRRKFITVREMLAHLD